MRNISLRVTSLVIVILLTVSFTAFAERATVSGNGVNVRTGPGTAYGIFASLDAGTAVEVMNRSNDSWYLVSWEGNSGYIASQFLELEAEDSSALVTTGQAAAPGYINGMYVCLRSGPGTTYTILGTYSNGKTLTINGSSGDWLSVSIDGKEGFVYSAYVEEGSPSSAVIEQETSNLYGGTPIASANASAVQNSGTVIVTAPLETASPAVTSTGTVSDNTNLLVPFVQPSSAPAAQASSSQVYVNPPQAEVTPPLSSPLVSAPAVSAMDTTASGVSSPASSLREAEIIGNAVRFRTGPGTTYSIIGTYDAGTRVTVRGTSGSWLSVIINGVSGYVHSDYVTDLSSNSVSAVLGTASSFSHTDASSFQVTDGFITGSSVRLREYPSMSANILAELNFGYAVKMTGISDGWTKVIYDGQEGYVSSSFVTEGTFEPAVSLSQSSGSELGKEIAAYALNYVGYPYKWGGNSPAVGFDCSGFVQYVFSQFGYSTSRVANDVRNDGIAVEASNIQPGDVLCFFSGSNYVGHVGIYVGDDSFVHAANSATGVVVTPMTNNYYASRGYEVRRITG